MPPPVDRPILHFTHVENVAGIFADGHLKADILVCQDGTAVTECAEITIKQRRRAVRVPVEPGGYVSDYVPFYFAPRSPMLYSIHQGNVATYTGGQDPLVYFWSRLSNLESLGLAWVASDGNCAHSVTHMTRDPNELEHIVDWPLMEEKMWRDTEDDGDRKRRRQAELLVHETFPVAAVRGIVVKSRAIADRVMEYAPPGLSVRVKPSWYF